MNSRCFGVIMQSHLLNELIAQSGVSTLFVVVIDLNCSSS